MEQFFQVVALVLMAVVLVLCVKRGKTGIGELLSIFVCGIVVASAVTYIKPVIDFVDSVQRISLVDSQVINLLLKVVGVSVVAEIAELICSDSGNAAMGKTLQFFASTVVIWLAIPLMRELLELIEEVLRGL